MFGFTEQEMDTYRDLAQDFAVEDLTPKIKNKSIFMTPIVMNDNEPMPDMHFLSQLLTDLETILTITTTNMAYEYAYLQCETEMNEKDIIQHLHTKYEDYVLRQFFKYGVAFTSDTTSEIVGEIMLELPYLYVYAVDDDNFDEDVFLDDRLEAYNDYLNENFSDEEDTEGEED